MTENISFQKWKIVRLSTIFIAVAFVTILLTNGINENSFRIAIRFTARSSFILFLLTFTASSLCKLHSNNVTTWLLKNRRYLGLSMAVSHGFHAVAIAGVAILTSENMVRDNHSANLGYVFIILMTITSFKRFSNILGRKNWRILHTVGMYYLWLSFTFAFSQRLNESLLIYLPFVLLAIVALILRFIPIKNKFNKKHSSP